MAHREKISLYNFNKMFPNEDSARKHIEEILWGKDNEHRCCPRCGSIRTSNSKHATMPYRCKDCDKRFSVRTGTVFESSNISLHQWLLAIYLLTTNLKGVSSYKIASDIGVTQKSAWHLAHRIRKTFDEQSDNPLMSPVEVDETYVGGLEKNKHSSKKTKGTQGRSTKTKAAVVGIKSRVDNKVKAKVTEPVNKQTLQGFIKETVTDGSTIYTDQNLGYKGLSRKGYKHKSVNHGVGEYIKDQAHTNGVESFWSMMKRGYTGVYHRMSKKHLQRYVDEYAGRHNSRPLPTINQMNDIVKGLSGKRLKYKELVRI